jgi:hypothetical protein
MTPTSTSLLFLVVGPVFCYFLMEFFSRCVLLTNKEAFIFSFSIFAFFLSVLPLFGVHLVYPQQGAESSPGEQEHIFLFLGFLFSLIGVLLLAKRKLQRPRE